MTCARFALDEEFVESTKKNVWLLTFWPSGAAGSRCLFGFMTLARFSTPFFAPVLCMPGEFLCDTQELT